MKTRKHSRVYWSTVAWALALVSPAYARTVYVSTAGDDANDGLNWATAKHTVQVGLNTALAGDQVWVAAGTYIENITLKLEVGLYGGFTGTENPATFDLANRDFQVSPTILDGNQAGSVVASPSGATPTTRIDGFTVRNGTGTVSGPYSRRFGGGIYCSNSSPSIAHNTITGNGANFGSGIYCYTSSPSIANNTIAGNRASSSGGGIYCQSSSAVIANNTISGNTADYDGAGIYCSNSNLTITCNTIAENSAVDPYDYGYGGGIYCQSSSATIANNTITGNTASGSAYASGGGIYSTGGSPAITNNTITGNAANSGGGIFCYTSSPTIANTVIAFNSSGLYNDGGNPVLRYNCVFGNPAYNYSGMADPTGTNGNISTDPKLAGFAYGNMHIQPDSPCVGAGDNGSVPPDTRDLDADGNTTEPLPFDLDGQPRIQGLNGIVDMGADESDGNAWPEGPYVIVRVTPDGDDTNDGSSWLLAKRTVQAGIDAVSALGGEVWVKAGTYPEQITLPRFAHVYGGFSGAEVTRNERNWATNVVILDGQQAGSVLTATAGHWVSTIDGFTFRNVGIYCYWASPTIANNTIMDSGCGIQCLSSFPMITNNTITGNGDGICCSRASPTIANNTIAENGGNGIYCYASSPTIANTIIAFNSSGLYNDGGNPVLRHNCVFGNPAYNYSGMADPTGTNGNISTDPKLAGFAYGNMHIQPDSPCVGAGDNGSVPLDRSDLDGDGDTTERLPFDLDGQPRIQGLNGIVDMGADESDGNAWPEGPYVIVRVTPDGDDTNDGSSWLLAKRTVQAGIDAVSALGGEVWVKAGTYPERIRLRPFAHVYGGFSGMEETGDQRDFRSNVTIIDGHQGGSVVTAEAGYVVSTIDGFTIRNGNAVFGGGIYCSSSSPSITNNTITGNSGAGIYCSNSSPSIANNTLTGNGADSGGGVYCSNSFPSITNNAITGNRGAGIYCSNSSPSITSNTISDNIARYKGGGICCFSYSSPVIANNTISGNTASGGGGIYCYTSSPSIANNAINGNTASSYYGGGIFCESSSARMENNTISGNTAFYDGGGICCSSYSSPTIANNTVSGNATSHSGGGISCRSSSPTIANNTIGGNTASDYGGGISCFDSSSLTIVNNTISGNTASSSGGGVFCEFSSPTIANNTITRNSAYDGGGIYAWRCSPAVTNTITAFNSSGIYYYPGGPDGPTLRHSCVYGNTAYNYSGITDPTGTNGNISGDPLFVRVATPGSDGQWGTSDDDYGNLRLQPGSPCIDAGVNAEVPADAADLDEDGNATEPTPVDADGHARFVEDPATVDAGVGTPPIVDIGANEYDPQGDDDGDGVGNTTDLCPNTIPGATVDQNGCPAPIPGDFNHDGDVDGADRGQFEICSTGPGIPQTSQNCVWAQLDDDEDVDQVDFAIFQRCYNGENVPADPNCGN